MLKIKSEAKQTAKEEIKLFLSDSSQIQQFVMKWLDNNKTEVMKNVKSAVDGTDYPYNNYARKYSSASSEMEEVKEEKGGEND